MRIVWTKEAEHDLESIYLFYLPKNERSAVNLYNRLINEADILLSSPKAGKKELLLKNTEDDFRSLVAGKYYKLIYTIHVSEIVIHAVWDCRRNPTYLLSSVK